MGCSQSTKEVVVANIKKESPEDLNVKYPPSESFEIPIDDVKDGKNNNSIIQSHPPKRLQRLLEAPTTPPTIKELEDKLANAEIRRKQILAERANTNKLKDRDSDKSESNSNDQIVEDADKSSELVQNIDDVLNDSTDEQAITDKIGQAENVAESDLLTDSAQSTDVNSENK